LGNSKLQFQFQRCHWHRWNRFSRLSKRLSRRIRIHMRNGFSPWVRALGGVDWWKNQRSKISCYCPFKKNFQNEKLCFSMAAQGNLFLLRFFLFTVLWKFYLSIMQFLSHYNYYFKNNSKNVQTLMKLLCIISNICYGDLLKIQRMGPDSGCPSLLYHCITISPH
jgi:hypothetical protein